MRVRVCRRSDRIRVLLRVNTSLIIPLTGAEVIGDLRRTHSPPTKSVDAIGGMKLVRWPKHRAMKRRHRRCIVATNGPTKRPPNPILLHLKTHTHYRRVHCLTLLTPPFEHRWRRGRQRRSSGVNIPRITQHLNTLSGFPCDHARSRVTRIRYLGVGARVSNTGERYKFSICSANPISPSRVTLVARNLNHFAGGPANRPRYATVRIWSFCRSAEVSRASCPGKFSIRHANPIPPARITRVALNRNHISSLADNRVQGAVIRILHVGSRAGLCDATLPHVNPAPSI